MIEVLIALVIVGIGLVGLLSLLSSSLKESGTIIEDSFASTLARSVYESLRESAHKRPFIVKNGAKYVKGFVFLHDGVKENGQTQPPLTPATFDPADPVVAARVAALQKSDYTIFLPNAPPTGGTGSGAGGEDIFVFPRPTAADDGTYGNGATLADLPGKSDFLTTPEPGYAGQLHYFKVDRTYELKSRTPSEVANGTDFWKAPPELADQYSFAVLVRRSVAPVLTTNDGTTLDAEGNKPVTWATNGVFDPAKFPPRGLTNTSSGEAMDGLYQVEVWVYRNFEKASKSRLHDPVRGGRLVGLLALGP